MKLNRTIAVLRRRLQREDGWVLATAIIVLTLTLAVGLAAYARVGEQQSQSRQERERDASFNVAESALTAEEQILASAWPTGASYPTQCTEATTGQQNCPTAAALNAAVDSSNVVDLKSGTAWTIRVRDNAVPTTSDYDVSTNGQLPYDVNGDRKLWVRADATIRGHRRSVVGLMQLEKFNEAVPANVITAGHMSVSDTGNKVLIDTQGSAATGSQVVVRCPQSAVDALDPTCVDYDRSKGQVSPDRVIGNPSYPPSMTQPQVDRFRALAQTNGTYYTSCPASLTGAVVFIEPSAGAPACSYSGSTFNSATVPGLVIMTSGSIEIGGNTTIYYGLLYLLNQQNTSGPVFTVHANGTLIGGVAVDGPGAVVAGSDKYNIQFDPRAFTSLASFGTAGLVQNTWRELPANTP